VTLWEGRLEGTSQEALEFSASLQVDRRLAAEDLRASRAHVHGLERAGLLRPEEAKVLRAALDRVQEELAGGSFAFVSSDEDIHTAIERRVRELAGDVGARLHAGRSRNDQVAEDLRLYIRDRLAQVAALVLDLVETLARRAEEAGDAYLPGYTHLQRAQPVLLAHHLLAHAWAFVRDAERAMDALRRVDVSVLGAGALGGSSLPLDPALVAAELGFGACFDNSMDAVSARDFAAEALFVLAMLGVHLSRLGEEVVLWSTQEFGFVKLPDSHATGSSMLPQKKNPDIAELVRAKTGRLVGNLVALLTVLKGLPLAYNRDLQEDKEPVFDSLDQAAGAARAMTGLIGALRFDTRRMAAAAEDAGLMAVDLAEWLVERGMPFREAHRLVGALVRDAEQRGVPLGELVQAHPALGSEAAALLDPVASLARRRTDGGSGPGAVGAQLERLRGQLAAERRRLADVRRSWR
jgi:argininosuccinate lyase